MGAMTTTPVTPEPPDPFGAVRNLETGSGSIRYLALDALAGEGARLELMPMTMKVLLENLLRNAGTKFATEEDVRALAMWGQKPLDTREFAFSPARVILQDFTGVPAVVDLAAMRSA